MYKITKTTEIFSHPRLTLLEDDIVLPNGEESKFLKFKHASNSGQTLAMNAEGEFLLTKEYSHAPGLDLVNFPGGLVKFDEDIAEGSKREFTEETGYKANKYEYLGMTYPYHRRQPEKLHLFLATGLEFIGENREAEEEGIELMWKSEFEIDALIAANIITNAHTLAHWAQYKAFRFQTDLVRAVAAVVENEKGEVLLMQRGPEARNHSEKWENAGGRVEDGEDILIGLKREIKEELGVEIKIVEALFSELSRNEKGEYAAYVFKAVALNEPQIMEPKKCSAIKWVAKEDLASYDLAPYTAADFKILGFTQN